MTSSLEMMDLAAVSAIVPLQLRLLVLAGEEGLERVKVGDGTMIVGTGSVAGGA